MQLNLIKAVVYLFLFSCFLFTNMLAKSAMKPNVKNKAKKNTIVSNMGLLFFKF